MTNPLTLNGVRAAAVATIGAALGLQRHQRWSWGPSWLRVWPFWESQASFRQRVFLAVVQRHVEQRLRTRSHVPDRS
jgi:hypothetical protein